MTPSFKPQQVNVEGSLGSSTKIVASDVSFNFNDRTLSSIKFAGVIRSLESRLQIVIVNGTKNFKNLEIKSSFCISQGSITVTILLLRYLTLFSAVHGFSSKKNKRTVVRVLETIEPILESIMVSLEKQIQMILSWLKSIAFQSLSHCPTGKIH